MKSFTIIIFLVLFYFINQLNAQILSTEELSRTFFFDAVCFKNSDTLGGFTDGLMDVLVLVPYQSLQFEKSNDVFNARYEIYIDILDSSGAKLQNEKIPKTIREKDYLVTQGGTAGFDIHSKRFYLNAGNYDIRINMLDLLSGKSSSKSRTVTIVNFDKFKIALSGIMLISSIEEKNGKYIITPHISDNVGMLSDGFFIFFEIYNNQNYDSLDFVYEIQNEKGEIILNSEKFQVDATNNISRQYKKVLFQAKTKQGIYKIRLIALKRNNLQDYTEDDYLAITERSLKFFKAFSGKIMDDIDLAVRYLKFVANPGDIDLIESAPNETEKQKLFEEFWKNIDPSPNTERNEAFDEYYSRIEYANKNFKSYTEGWLSDMGMVYIIFGPPDYIDKSDNYGSRTVYVKWTYMSNREFLFSDETSMGDFRLVRPYSVTEKYKYGD